jgi:glycosyltransferase involved in cell wall biosynthesis
VRVLIDYRPALRERSGVGEYTHELVKALLAVYSPGGAAPALDLSLFSSSWKDRLAPAAELAGAVIVDRRVPVRLLNLSWHRLGWPPAEMLGGGAYDVTHSLHPLLLPARAAAHVVTIHDLDFLSHPERTRAEVRRDYPALAREHAHRADAILVPSAYTAGEVERVLGVAPDRLTICPPGAPDWVPRPASPKRGYVLFFSTLEPRKNVVGLLDAYERLLSAASTAKAAPYERGTADAATNDPAYVGRSFRGAIPELVLAGKATEDARAWLERLERPPLKGLVRHVGYIEPDKRRALYEGARLLVQPSFEEGFGMPVLEAMSLGVPVVAANRGSLPEVVGDAGPLVDPERPADIANAIAQVLFDDEYAAACVSRGLVRARSYRWDRTARRVFGAYRQAIERRAQRIRRA